ncbi:bifunctional [glutamine synthetase] adenylyltransferase/[glutamine synthetase]-adenylyl-L-tyrosine phosphorylase [Rhodoligotrophos defluvii]|uniref:bifunctional [glutamine synthetase] adenylyltransferase/[glutamine synthetase]-adenylyl-L-tyrosine phosphorylase n=1 Tax=Rhodoligotrophos defluvii TaxID=2561934 RepID=UPI0010C94FB9|nr:bifunctional [glutamine synthetase] adenylyltransferase/[glutamine synthetase]-adenylyl-L-tyrosine phosphorylase [Rhodoligotrophos defluvii]
MLDPLPKTLITRPGPEGEGLAAPFLADIAKAAGEGDEGAVRLIHCIEADARQRALLAGIIAGSPFLRSLILRDLALAADLLASGDLTQRAEGMLADLCDRLGRQGAAAANDTELKRLLRQARKRAALIIALADLSGGWSVGQVTAGLTRFADAALNAAVDWLLADAGRRGQLTLHDPARPSSGSGFILLAMGKYGAGELNYSSDIDLIVFYDPAVAPLGPTVEPATFFVKLTKRLVNLLQDITADGYVFRVDLRLRPDPRATSAAIAVEAAAIYYEHMGQNWERAAMIKARPAAGDIAAGNEMLARLSPFIWRKYLDFAAILDVQSLKRQIQAVRGHGAVAVHGHNIKLGRGGIREIEFFVQTQQLIAGGRNPQLRGRETLPMLDALAEAEWITPETAAELKSAYLYLRAIEHRIQMVADEQSHTLPAAGEAFTRFAHFAGYADVHACEDDLERVLRCVEKHYAALFEESPALGTEAGSLVFTGGDDDPETLEALRKLGFRGVSEIAATIRSWHFGRYHATRSARARERLTEIMPVLLSALARSGDPDAAFIAFDRFLAGLPAGVQLFSLLWANPHLLNLIADIMGTAPRLAAILSHRPRTFDAVLDPGFFGPLPGEQELRQLVDAALGGARSYEEFLDQARAVGNEQLFRIGVRILADSVNVEEAGSAYARLADILVDRLLAASAEDLARRHGRISGGEVALIAMGKWGGREMTATSDLDMILIYDMDEGVDQSDGPKPLTPAQYYARLSQRLIAALSAPSAEGVLYAVDMRLRPSGNAGPVATHIQRFETYQQGEAWTWERMALTRARVIHGTPRLKARIERAVRQALASKRDPQALRADVRDMRRRLEAEFGRGGAWDLKQTPGGLVDIEFIAQYLQLVHAADDPAILDQNTQAALAKLAADGLIDPEAERVLSGANRFYQRLTQLLRVCVTGRFEAQTAPEGLKRLLARAGELPDFRTLDGYLPELQADVRRQFIRLVGDV